MAVPPDLRTRAARSSFAFENGARDVESLVEMLRVAEGLQRYANPIKWDSGDLRPPASDEDLERLRGALPSVPPALEALYRWHDGQASPPVQRMPGADVLGVDDGFRSIATAFEWIDFCRTSDSRFPLAPSQFPHGTYASGDSFVETARGEHHGFVGTRDRDDCEPPDHEEPLAERIRDFLDDSLRAAEHATWLPYTVDVGPEDLWWARYDDLRSMSLRRAPAGTTVVQHRPHGLAVWLRLDRPFGWTTELGDSEAELLRCVCDRLRSDCLDAQGMWLDDPIADLAEIDRPPPGTLEVPPALREGHPFHSPPPPPTGLRVGIARFGPRQGHGGRLRARLGSLLHAHRLRRLRRAMPPTSPPDETDAPPPSPDDA